MTGTVHYQPLPPVAGRPRSATHLATLCLFTGVVGLFLSLALLLVLLRIGNKPPPRGSTPGYAIPVPRVELAYSGDCTGPDGIPRPRREAVLSRMSALPNFTPDRAAMLDRLLADVGAYVDGTSGSGNEILEIGQLSAGIIGIDQLASHFILTPSMIALIDNNRVILIDRRSNMQWRFHANNYVQDAVTNPYRRGHPSAAAIGEVLDHWRRKLGVGFTARHGAILAQLAMAEPLTYREPSTFAFDEIANATLDAKGLLVATRRGAPIYIYADGLTLDDPKYPHDPATGLPRAGAGRDRLLERWKTGARLTLGDRGIWALGAILAACASAMLLLAGTRLLIARRGVVWLLQAYLGVKPFVVLWAVIAAWRMAEGAQVMIAASCEPLAWIGRAGLIEFGYLAVLTTVIVAALCLPDIRIARLLRARDMQRYQRDVQARDAAASLGFRNSVAGHYNARAGKSVRRFARAAVLPLAVLLAFAHAIMSAAPVYDRDWSIASHWAAAAAMIFVAFQCRPRNRKPKWSLRVARTATWLIALSMLAGAAPPRLKIYSPDVQFKVNAVLNASSAYLPAQRRRALFELAVIIDRAELLPLADSDPTLIFGPGIPFDRQYLC